MVRSISRIAVLTVISSLLGIFVYTSAMADSCEALYPCFKGISGWSSDPPMNASMNMGGLKMLNVTRTYHKGEKELVVILTSGAMAQASWMPYQEGTEVNTPQGSISIKNMRGYTVQILEDKEEHSATVSVMLNQGSSGDQSNWTILTFASTNMSKGELLDLSKSFDWDCFKAKIKSVR